MSVWTRDITTHRLTRTTLPTMAENNQPRTLMDRIFPDRVSVPSCITLPTPTGNHFEIHSSHINTLPKFGNFDNDDPYIFITKFKQVCATIKLQQLCDDGIKLRSIPFALTDYAEKWLYSLPPNSIKTWNEFVTTFLKNSTPWKK